MRRVIPVAFIVALFSLIAPAAAAQTPVAYTVAFPAPQHHYAQVEILLADLAAAPLQLRMSRSSPGRYALHEFAKNVFDVRVFDESGRELPVVHAAPHEWDVAQHPPRVRVTYKVFGNLVDGTYLGIDAS